jgi:hypothetical protein
MDLQELIDRQQIVDTIYRYCRGVDRLDKELIASAYHPDAWDDHGTFKVRGSECPDVIVNRLQKQCKASMHCITNVLVDFRSDKLADTEAYFVAWLAFDRPDGQYTRSLGGRYVDQFARRDDVWRIANRVVVYEWSRIDRIVEPWPSGAKMHPGLRSRDDVTYTHTQIERGRFIGEIYTGRHD